MIITENRKLQSYKTAKNHGSQINLRTVYKWVDECDMDGNVVTQKTLLYSIEPKEKIKEGSSWPDRKR
jgi:hypothetical protein